MMNQTFEPYVAPSAQDFVIARGLHIPTTPFETEEVAERTHRVLQDESVLMVRLAGPPGAGKTSLVNATIRQLGGRYRIGVIVVNPAAHRDADQIRPHCHQVAVIESAIPEPRHIYDALRGFKLEGLDIVLIEACGGIVPFPYVGEDFIAAMFPVSGGDDKAAEYPALVARASVIIVGKTDLRRYVRFDLDVFRHDVQKLNPAVQLIELSMGDDAGLAAWLQWLQGHADQKRSAAGNRLPPCEPDYFFG